MDTISNKKSFYGALNNKALLKTLEFASDHSATFVAGTSALMAMTVKPLSIAMAPKTDKKNKQYLATEAIASGLMKFLMVEAVAVPVEKALKVIDKKPDKYLTEKTIKNLKEPAKDLLNSKDYKILTQVIRQLSGFVSAIPKSMITIALIPVLMDLLFKEKSKKQNNNSQKLQVGKTSEIFDEISFQKQKSPSFKGSVNEVLANGIGKIVNNSSVQNVVKKANFKEANIARNVSIATDLLLTSSFILSTKKSKKIEKERKNPLIFNHLISTGAFFAVGCSADNFIQKTTKPFVDKFAQANKSNPKLPKYLTGINTMRSTLTFALIYYALLPVASTFLSDKLDKLVHKPKKEEKL